MASSGWEKVTLADVASRTRQVKPAGVPPPRRQPAPGRFDPFVALVCANGMPEPDTEQRFVPDRRFLADYIWPAFKVIVEREGGLWSKDERAQRAHSKPLKILRDMEKANLAQLYGYRYLRFTPEQLDRGDALQMVRHFLKEGGWKA